MRPDRRPARIAVVIVTYNSADVLGNCLRSLTTQDVHLTTVAVADNESHDDSLAIAKAASDLPVMAIQMGRNAGYAAAVNAGMAAVTVAEVDAILVLNPDCVLWPGALGKLAAALRHPGRGIVVPRLVNPDGTLQPSLRRTPTVSRAFAEAVLGGSVAGRIGTLSELITDPRPYERPGRAVWATGAAMLISADALADIGPWDESFWLYSEETEFAMRAADHGWALWYEPAAVVEHVGGESGTNPDLAALLAVNKVRLFRRRRGRLASAVYYLAALVGEAARAVAGRPTSRAALVALLRSSRRIGPGQVDVGAEAWR